MEGGFTIQSFFHDLFIYLFACLLVCSSKESNTCLNRVCTIDSESQSSNKGCECGVACKERDRCCPDRDEVCEGCSDHGDLVALIASVSNIPGADFVNDCSILADFAMCDDDVFAS